MDDDIISHLPRDILDRIVSRLDLRDALRTNLLSRRWRDISSSFAPSMVDFQYLNMFPSSGNCEKPCLEYKDKFIFGVNQYAKFYHGDKVINFGFCCCLGPDSCHDIDRWVRFAIEKGCEELLLELYCPKRCIPMQEKYVLRYELFEDATVNLKGLYLVSCTVPQNSMSVFKCLSKFAMSFSKIVVQHPNILFSGWSKLRTLDFIHCCLPETLCFGSLVSLKEFKLVQCSGVQSIEFSNANLKILSCVSHNDLKLNLAGVPNLLELNYSVQESGFSDAFTVLSRDLPKLLQLCFFTFADWIRTLKEF